MENKKKKIKINTIDALVLLYLLGLFGFFFFGFEVKEYSDSFQLLNQFPTRDPGYGLLLKLCRDVFTQAFFLKALGFIQNGLAVVSIWFLGRYIVKAFRFPDFFKLIVAGLLTLPHIMTPFASSTHLILTNAVLTEGVSISLFYLWIILMLRLLYEKSIWNDAGALLMALLLSLIRGQLMVCLLVWLLAMGIRLIAQRRAVWVLMAAAALAAVFALRTGIVRGYNDHFWQMNTDTFAGKAMMVANVLYVAQPEDAEKLETPYLKELCREILTAMEADGITFADAEGNILDKAMFHNDVHDKINFEYFEPVVRAWLKDTEGLDEMNYLYLMYRVDEVAAEMMKELLPQVLGDYVQNYLLVAGLGFLRSIAVEWVWLIPYAAGMYLLGLGGSSYLLIRKKGSRAAWFMLLMLLLIGGNVLATALMLQCISRYMIYNFPLFYIALLAMAGELFGWKKEDDHADSLSD